MSKKDKELGKPKVIQEYRDKLSMELFGKPEYKLAYAEGAILERYVYDCLHPKWKTVKCDYTDREVEVNQTGKCVRDPETKEPYKIYMPDSCNFNYPTIYIRMDDDRKSITQTVHRLVAKAFVENPDSKTKIQVNHIDGNKINNWYQNLEWCTASENMQHAFRTGLNVALKGEEAGRANCTEEQVRQVCELLIAHPDWTFTKISQETGVSHASVQEISQRKIWLDTIKDYGPFPKRCAILRGEDVGNSVYTDDQIKQVCQLLQDHPEMKYDEITKITGVKKPMISTIYNGDHWTHISMNYKFPPRQTQCKGENGTGAKYTNKQAEQVCQLLDQVYLGKSSLTHRQIAEQVCVSKDMVKEINRGRSWIDIAKNHKFYQAKFGEKEVNER